MNEHLLDILCLTFILNIFFILGYSGRPLPLSLRSDVWTHCLEISERKSRVEKFDDVYDHPEQPAIHQAAANLVAGANLQLQAEAESILTVFFKNSGVAFNKSLSSLMKPIINLNLTRNEKYSIFQTVLDRFIPKNLKDSAVFDLARLLLLYHDPQLCNHLDSLKIGFQHFSLSWFSSLMAEGLFCSCSSFHLSLFPRL